ncbi:ROK family protein [Streptococcus merionis]|uniref:ROK family protein n=1 Tax=Streptococcus merionis TaxID=400065 RepID=UPI003512157D
MSFFEVEYNKMANRCANRLSLKDKKDGLAVFAAINVKVERVDPIFEAYCREIAYLIYNVQAVIDMTRVVIGGGISAQEIVVQEIERQYQIILDALG